MAFWDIGAGALLQGAGSLFNAFSQKETNEENNASRERINQQNLQWAREQQARQEHYAQLNMDQQREFAQSGIRWKVADATLAGLHPLAALGSQVSSFSPISVGTSSPSLESSSSKAPSVDFSGMGQSVDRAIDAGSTAAERTDRAAKAVSTVQQLEKGNLELDILSSTAAKNRAQLGPPIPIPRPGPQRATMGEAVKDDDIKQKAEDHPATAIVKPFGYPLNANPFFSDGQQFEDRYGDSELGSTLKFAVNTIADHVYTGLGLLDKHVIKREPSESDRAWFNRQIRR